MVRYFKTEPGALVKIAEKAKKIVVETYTETRRDNFSTFEYNIEKKELRVDGIVYYGNTIEITSKINNFINSES